MYTIHQLTFSPFAENTYLIQNTANEVVIVDPGMYGSEEEARFDRYLETTGLKPVAFWLTHAHLDHIFGARYVSEKYGLVPRLHALDAPIYENARLVAMQYGLQMEDPPAVQLDLAHGMVLEHGEGPIALYHAPGHSPGSIVFHMPDQEMLIGGDVLFQGSIGRTDLPGGDFETLIRSIRERLLVLSDDTVVYSGHGPLTTIGQERATNYYLV